MRELPSEAGEDTRPVQKKMMLLDQSPMDSVSAAAISCSEQAMFCVHLAVVNVCLFPPPTKAWRAARGLTIEQDLEAQSRLRTPAPEKELADCTVSRAYAES